MVNIKSSIIKEIMNKGNAFQACESTCHECTSKDVENYKEDIVVEKEELFMKKDMKNKEIMRN